MFIYSADERDALNKFFDLLFEDYLEDKKSESEDKENEEYFDQNDK